MTWPPTVCAAGSVFPDQLADPRLYYGTPLAADEFVRLALEADILPALFDTKGQSLRLGRAMRHAGDAQRIALAVRDKGWVGCGASGSYCELRVRRGPHLHLRGCVGCGAAGSYCETHHVRYWQDGGPTDPDNLCVLCGHCHHREIHSKRGAEIMRRPDGESVDPGLTLLGSRGERDLKAECPLSSVDPVLTLRDSRANSIHQSEDISDLHRTHVVSVTGVW